MSNPVVTAAEKKYFLSIHGRQTGPYRTSVLRKMWEEGRILPEALVHKVKEAEWGPCDWEPIDPIVVGVESPFTIPRLCVWAEAGSSLGLIGGFLGALAGGITLASGAPVGWAIIAIGSSLFGFGLLSYVAWQIGDLLGRIAASSARAAIAQEAALNAEA